MCLLLGFQGKYMIEGQEKLGYLTARLGDEIALLRGKRAGFAPHWPLPDKIAHTLKRDVPLWSIGAMFALLGLLAYLGMSHFLNTDMQTAMAPYHDIVKLGPRAAHLTISLP
jgi:type VI secretion system protein ImpK